MKRPATTVFLMLASVLLLGGLAHAQYERQREDRPDRERAGSLANQNGYGAGLQSGRDDHSANKSFNPNRHSHYKDGTSGYQSSYGSKSEYKREYRSAFMKGYEEGYGRRSEGGSRR